MNRALPVGYGLNATVLRLVYWMHEVALDSIAFTNCILFAGNNFYDAELLEKLDSLVDTPEAGAFVLMQRLRPFVFQNYVLTPKGRACEVLRMVSEFGVYGVILATDNTVHTNYSCGHLLRSKVCDVIL